MIFISILYLLLSFFLVISVVIFCVIIIYTIIFRVPPISTNSKVFEGIYKELGLSSSSYLCDIGCGTGSFLKYTIKKTLGAKGFGCEINLPVAFYSKYVTRNLPIVISVKNFNSDEVKKELSQATHVYCYLLPKILDELLPILQSSCKKGTKIFSCDYSFSSLSSKRHVIFTKEKRLGKELFVYEI